MKIFRGIALGLPYFLEIFFQLDFIKNHEENFQIFVENQIRYHEAKGKEIVPKQKAKGITFKHDARERERESERMKERRKKIQFRFLLMSLVFHSEN